MLKRFSSIRTCLLVVLMLGLFSFPPVINQASACPMCKQLNETDDNKPQAYMYSITFMLAMPAILFSGFGIVFYKMNRREQEALLENENSQNPHVPNVDPGLND
ncbi:hypothetical protein [Gimesia aquarii]|uniref:Uncharacterized protein n=1 Tax=Gimesia aquarii TaxID=2527964 RepID=A0A517WUI1_9PLAN|nr:hypothetical protein [Gimesia aquarii]QDU08882.1 hypothetical protein V202x_22520 [Gimesia aquarii]